jgi:hypothetical protein
MTSLHQQPTGLSSQNQPGVSANVPDSPISYPSPDNFHAEGEYADLDPVFEGGESLDAMHIDAGTPTQPVIEEYPGASKVFGVGSTFMDKFNSDVHVNKRASNLYYPFASRDEWQLASFLLHSNLSMTAINQFLSLNLVSSPYPLHSVESNFNNICFRFKTFSYRSKMQINCEVGLKCYQKGPNGTVNCGQQYTPPSCQSIFTIATLLNVCSHSCTTL